MGGGPRSMSSCRPPPCRTSWARSYFAGANIGRHLQVDSEQALLGGIAKFRRRFGHIEQQLSAKGLALTEASLDDMEALWQDAKRAGL